jgi:GNAT superfamily N-acetyltransferase
MMTMKCKMDFPPVHPLSVILLLTRDLGSDAPSQPANTEALPVELLRDAPNWLLAVQNLRETDVIILLTPIVIPISQNPTDTSDPFEPLGRSLAKRHSRIRQIPYTQRSEVSHTPRLQPPNERARNGITSTHLGFIKRGHVIILCFALDPSQQLQQEFAEVTFAVSDNKPCIIVVCCKPIEISQALLFPTVIQAIDYSPLVLEATAALIFGEAAPSLSGRQPESTTDAQRPRLWLVEQWNEARDITSVLSLWHECTSSRFSIDQRTLASLLRRPGYAKHYVVREPRNGEILGFCATYLSYVDKEGENLIASLAVLLVRSLSRQQGIGLSLHNHAIIQLKRTRGVMRLQLGSTFPRIFYGPSSEMQLNEDWFRRRGWQLHKPNVPGQGLIVRDMILDFADWRYAEERSGQEVMSFRLCTQEDMVGVLEIVEMTCARQAKMGWYDQYLSLMNGPNVKDVVIGVKNDTVVAIALTYTPFCGSQIASNLPWAGRIGNDIGGVTCLCLTCKSVLAFWYLIQR